MTLGGNATLTSTGAGDITVTRVQGSGTQDLTINTAGLTTIDGSGANVINGINVLTTDAPGTALLRGPIGANVLTSTS